MSTEYRNFLALPYEELEELNLQAKKERLSRTPADEDLCPSCHAGAKSRVGVLNGNFHGKGAFAVARRRLGADD